MKLQLTKEQSQHLIELGIDKYTASEVECEGAGNEIDKYVYFFTLIDLLEILPKEIFDEDLYSRNYLTLECTNTGLWHVGYAHEVSYEGYFFMIERFADELIDALYELCVWCLENGYL